MKLFVFIAMASIFPIYASNGVTGNEMLRYCNAIIKQSEEKELSAEESVGIMYAIGYLSGFTESHAVEMAFSEPKKKLYCLPPNGVENQQLARIIQKHLKQNPERLHENVRVEILIAFSKTFPCEENKERKGAP